MKILLGMSGGVDSTYAVEELRRAGHQVEGAVLIMHKHTNVSAARAAAKQMNVPLHEIDCTDAFEKIVSASFISEYLKGKTPNPCTVCNPNVKFKFLCDFAKNGGFDRVATGHYSSIFRSEIGRFCIKMSVDTKKDQSYMLWSLSQNQLEMLHLPLENLRKNDVQNASRALKIEAAEAPESMDICFLPNGNYAEFIENRVGKCPPGDFLDKNGTVIGRHKGIIHYTIGQRKGLGAFGERVFVTAIDHKNNTVTLAQNDQLFTKKMTVTDLNFQLIPHPCPEKPAKFELFCKVRYSAPPQAASVTIFGDTATVTFNEAVRAVTAGQSAVFYLDDKIAFGGVISSAF